MVHALVMALAGYTSTFKKVIIAVPNEIGERRDRNGNFIANTYKCLLGKSFDLKYIKKRFPSVRLPPARQDLRQENEIIKEM